MLAGGLQALEENSGKLPFLPLGGVALSMTVASLKPQEQDALVSASLTGAFKL